MEKQEFCLLIVEDEKAELSRLKKVFERSHSKVNILTATTPIAACNQFRKHRPEVVILDLGLSGFGPAAGLDVISQMNRIDPTSRIITLTGHTGDDIGFQAIQNGAASFLAKPASDIALNTLVTDYVQTAKFRRQAQREVSTEPIDGFIGQSSAMKNVYRLIQECSKNNSNVLIVGETGTGKELVAQAIHNLSDRRNNNLSIYFGASPASLAESELFGYVKGAYTGATSKGGNGCLKDADGGTLFIDELCSLDLSIQKKLLRALETKTYKPLGSEKMVSSDFRLVCAAQPRIFDLVRTQQFREDLLSRVEVLTIKIPPLRERREDIVPLAEHFQKIVKKELSNSRVPCNVWGFTKEAVREFHKYHWPRNVRQLKHTIHNGMIQAQLRGSDRLDVEDVKGRLNEEVPKLELSNLIEPGSTLKETVEEIEKEVISMTLKRHNNTLSSACRELGIGRTTLWRKMKDYNMNPNIEK